MTMQHRRIAVPLVAVFVAVSGAAFTGCGTDADDGASAATASPTKTKERQVDEEESAQGGREETKTGEREDLISFKIDDRSQAGITNVWVTWTIKNNSSEKSNYTWDWEAIDPSGKRIANSTELATNVQPGQTATGEMPTVITNAEVKLNVTDFDRTRAY
ncbi:hypothetical protein [Streptomyces sp. NPDC047070]|uniref:hypothetical protein n=1 Tax=Streptomyces sp. NPDC047070 TaxID=3154923 RepID=UPI0034571F7E